MIGRVWRDGGGWARGTRGWFARTSKYATAHSVGTGDAQGLRSSVQRISGRPFLIISTTGGGLVRNALSTLLWVLLLCHTSYYYGGGFMPTACTTPGRTPPTIHSNQLLYFGGPYNALGYFQCTDAAPQLGRPHAALGAPIESRTVRTRPFADDTGHSRSVFAATVGESPTSLTSWRNNAYQKRGNSREAGPRDIFKGNACKAHSDCMKYDSNAICQPLVCVCSASSCMCVCEVCVCVCVCVCTDVCARASASTSE